MIDGFDLPPNLMGSFKRVSRRIPAELKKDDELMRTVVAFLRLGGEKLARQAIDAARQTQELEIAERKKKAREEALVRAAEARLAAVDKPSTEDGEYDDEDDDDASDDIKDY